MKPIVLLALVLFASVWAMPVLGQHRVAVKFDVAEILSSTEINAAAACIFVDTSTGDIFVGTGTNYVYRSSDDGNTWVHLTNGLDSANVPFGCIYAIAEVANGTLLLGSLGDLFSSTNNGNSWNAVPELNSPNPQVIAVKNSTVFVGTFFGGSVCRSTDNGKTWSKVLNPPNSGYRAITITKTGAILVGDGNGDPQGEVQGIWRSSDNGNSWSRADSGLIGEIGTVGDGSLNPDGTVKTNGYNIWGLSTDSSTGVVYAATDGEGIFRSTDDGQNWVHVNGKNPLFGSAVLAVNGDVWTAYHNDIGYQVGGLYYSADSGATWQDVDSIFIGQNVNCLYAYGEDSILVGTDDGVYIVSSETVTAVNEPIRGPSTFTLYQNYPNPFNPTTTIEYSVSKRSHVSLEVYDVLGREVAVLVDAVKTPGNYRAIFDGADLPSGVYFYRLEAAGFTSVKKLILMK